MGARLTNRERGEFIHISEGVKSLGGHFACLCRGFEFYDVKKNAITPK